MKTMILCLVVVLMLVVTACWSPTTTVHILQGGNGVQVQLAVILDASGSIDNDEWDIMVTGLAQSLNSSECVPHDGSVELTVILFAEDATVGLGPLVLTGANAAEVTNNITNLSRSGIGIYTCISCGLCLAADTLAASPHFDPDLKQVINLVTDGEPNRCSCSGGTCGYTGSSSGCDGEASAECARDYAITTLNMTSDQDELDAEFIGGIGDPSAWLVDEIVWPGDGHYLDGQIRVPVADGDISGTWNPTPSSPTTRWDKVDETSYDDTDYITGTTNSGGYALFDITAFDVPAGSTIEGLTVVIRVRDSTSGNNNIYERIKVNGSYYSGATSHNPGTSFTTYSYTWATNPATGSNWTVADINGTGSNALQQIGVHSTDLNPDMRVSMIYALVRCTELINTDPGWVRVFETFEEFVPSLCQKFELTLHGSITAHKFNDLNGNGVQDGGEANLAGWNMTLYSGPDCSGSPLASNETNAAGNVTFSDLVAGNYSVQEMLEGGWTNSTALCQQVTIATGQSVTLNFGNLCISPTAAFNATPTSGCEPSLIVTFTEQSTGSPTSWNWSFPGGTPSSYTGQTPPAVNYSSAGSYSVGLAVSNACGSDTETKTNYITVYPNPTVNIAPDGGELTCATAFIILTADTGGSACTITSYQWYKDDVALGGQTGTTLNVTSLGDYKVEVECANGCTDEDEVTVTQSANYPTVNITPNGGELTCATTFIILTADTSGSACTVTSYQWYKDDVALGGQTGTTLSVTSPGDYKVEVECANDCSASDSVVVTQDISAPSVNAGPDQEVCEDGGPITLSGATPSGGTWSGTGVSGDTFDPSGLTPGDYTVTYSYTDTGTGCSNSDTKTVTVNAKPTADAGADAVIISGDSVVIGGTPTASGGTPLYTYSWTPTTGLNDASFANPTASPAVSTTYTVTVTDSNGCTDSDDVTVTVIQDCCICGFVYRAGTTEPLVGWKVVLEQHINPWVEIGSAITDANGKYWFCGLEAGEYRVSEVVQPNWNQVSPLPNEFLVTLPGGCCDPQSGPFRDFQNQQGGLFTVGWEASAIDKLAVLVPWIVLFAAIVAGAGLLVLRRRA